MANQTSGLFTHMGGDAVRAFVRETRHELDKHGTRL